MSSHKRLSPSKARRNFPTGAQIQNAMNQPINPFTGRPVSARYRQLLETRQQLPVTAYMDQFLTMYNENQIILLVGETGSGKTTQIPQYVVYSDLQSRKGKMVACTQPRRIAATSVAKRVADEMDVELGKHVGYSIRFEDMTDPTTTVLKYMTDGLLLREAMQDHSLSRYSTIILDEVHERTLATDILMGILKILAKKRKDLKIIIMSATLDAIKFQKYFSLDGDLGITPLFQFPGRMHQVELFYTSEPEKDYVEAAMRTALQIHRFEDPGDILVFLTGEEEIEDACRKIKSEADDLILQDPRSIGPLLVLPLYSSLPPAAQQRIFDAAPPPRYPGGHPGRKVVVSTNVAETSLTISGIVYVVDPGFSKQKVYNPRIRVESLLVSPISQASAQQRSGRAGRTRPGKSFRLYTEKDFYEQLTPQTPPEIHRSNLANTVLELAKLGITDLVTFDYVDAPAPEILMRALELLHYLGALDNQSRITDLGKMMADLPLDPQLAKMLITSPQFGCSEEVLTITAMLSAPNVYVRPFYRQREAAAAHALFDIPEGDHLTLLNIFEEYQIHIADKSWPMRNYLSPRALTQAASIRQQLRRLMVERFHLPLVSILDNERKRRDVIRKVVVCGFFMHVAHKGDQGSYLTIKDNQPVSLHPSCGMREAPEWVIYNEYVLTKQAFIRTVSAVRPEWLLEYGSDYFDLSTFPDGPMKDALQRILIEKVSQNHPEEVLQQQNKGKKKASSGAVAVAVPAGRIVEKAHITVMGSEQAVEVENIGENTTQPSAGNAKKARRRNKRANNNNS